MHGGLVQLRFCAAPGPLRLFRRRWYLPLLAATRAWALALVPHRLWSRAQTVLQPTTRADSLIISHHDSLAELVLPW